MVLIESLEIKVALQKAHKCCWTWWDHCRSQIELAADVQGAAAIPVTLLAFQSFRRSPNGSFLGTELPILEEFSGNGQAFQIWQVNASCYFWSYYHFAIQMMPKWHHSLISKNITLVREVFEEPQKKAGIVSEDLGNCKWWKTNSCEISDT